MRDNNSKLQAHLTLKTVSMIFTSCVLVGLVAQNFNNPKLLLISFALMVIMQIAKVGEIHPGLIERVFAILGLFTLIFFH